MSDENLPPPVIEFPCDYPIKVIADSDPDLVFQVVTILRRYDANLSLDRIKERPSKQGNYTSVTVFITATGKPQLKALFEEFKTHDWVRMVL
jgi:putative lipoic acid-binding regulatory protein